MKIDLYASRRPNPYYAPHVPTIEERLVAKLDQTGEHWIFTGATDQRGYGLLWDGRRKNNSRAHRIAYELWVGPIPDGFDVHHECRVRACCLPAHLLAVPDADHLDQHHRPTHCENGHEFTGENTYTDPHGWRQCIICRRVTSRRYREAHADRINAHKRERRRSR